MLTSWTKSKDAVITGSTAGAQTDYQIKTTITYESEMNTDFSDIRFTATDDTLYDFWLKEKTDSVSATFYVKIPSIPISPNTTTLRMQYGNASAASASSGDDTFLFFDDFSVGTVVDESKWNVIQDRSDGIWVVQHKVTDVFTALSGGQGLAADGTYFYVGKSNGNGVDGTIYKYEYDGTAVTNFIAPEHAAEIDIREDHGNLICASSNANPHELWEISKTGTKVRSWTITDSIYSVGSLVAYKTTDTVYFLVGDASNNFKIYELTLNDDGTYTEVDFWTGTDLGVAQGLDYIDGELYYLTSYNSTKHRIHKITLNTDGTTSYVFTYSLDSSYGSWGEVEGLAYDGSDWYFGDYSKKIHRIDNNPEGKIVCSNKTYLTGYIQSLSAYGPGVALISESKVSGDYPAPIALGDTSNPFYVDNMVCLGRVHSGDSYLYGRQRLSASQTEETYSGTTNWESYQEYEIQYKSGNVKYFQNGSELSSGWITSNVPSAALRPMFGLGTYGNGTGGTVTVNYCALRKFVDAEPVIDTWVASGTTDSLTASSITTGTPIIGTPSITQVHTLISSSVVTGSPTLGTPTLTSSSTDDNLASTDIATGSPVLGTPAITQIHTLVSNAILTGVPVINSPVITQGHALLSTEVVTGTPVIGTPSLTPAVGEDALDAVQIIAGVPIITTPTITQIHVLGASNVLTANVVISSPRLDWSQPIVPGTRTYVVKTESRDYVIPKENRVYTVPEENRTYKIGV